MPKSFLTQESLYWEKHLFERILPFWLKSAKAPDGGLYTCIDDYGKLISTDKWIWSQMRAVWVFSRLYNTIDRDLQWLELAGSIFDFVQSHAWIEEDKVWALCTNGDGNIVRGNESIYVDGFALYGMAELYRAKPDPELLRWIQITEKSVNARLQLPHDQIPHFPYPIPQGASVHGIPMIFSHVYDSMQGIPGGDWATKADILGESILKDFYRPELGLIVERIAKNGNPFPGNKGTAVVPGHVIESLWFQFQRCINNNKHNDLKRLFEWLKRHLNFGWDEKFGGILLAKDAHGSEPVGWDFPTSKLWWPHTEALYATLLAYSLTGDREFRMWYERIKTWSLEKFAVIPHSEWIQKLDRKGNPISDTVALPVKDPFHLPRSLILMIELGRKNGRDASPRDLRHPIYRRHHSP